MKIESKPNFPELKSPPKTIANLYLHLKPDEQAEAADTLKRYVALVWRIYRRVRRPSSEEFRKTKKFDENPFKR
jgi:hypothetical protein